MHDADRSGADQEFGSQMLEAALQTAVGAIVIIDDGGLVRTVNPATQKLFGYSESELIGQNVSLLMPEPFRSRHDGYIRHHLETGERKIIGIGRQVMGRRKSGAIFPMHLSVSAFTADGRRYFTGIVHDLSEQRGTGALREQALFEAIFNHLPDAVLVTDAESKVVLCNPAVGRVFGYAPEELIGQRTAVLYDTPAEYERIRSVESRLREQELPEPVTVRYRRKSGEGFPAETVTSVLRDQDGQFIGLISLNRDISRQVVQDEALRKSQRMEAIGQLSGGIAHDFNNLLTIITGNHELLEMELEDAEQRDLLARANNAALMGARLTNRLLTFARRRRLDPVVLDLNEQVLVMAELLRRTLGEAIALGTLLAPRLWSVQADPSEVENAVLNLAINSRDAMPAGGKLVIETSNVMLEESDVANEVGGEPGEYVRLSVSDTGTGMSREVLTRVFEPFFTTKETRQGHGPGLERDLWLRQAVGRPRDGLQRDRPGHDRQPVPPADRHRARAGGKRQAGSTRPAADRRDDPAGGGQPRRAQGHGAAPAEPRLRRRRGRQRGACGGGAERGREDRSRVQRRGDAGRHVGLRSGALGAGERSGPSRSCSPPASPRTSRGPAKRRHRSWRSCASPIPAPSWRAPCARPWVRAS